MFSKHDYAQPGAHVERDGEHVDRNPFMCKHLWSSHSQ